MAIINKTTVSLRFRGDELQPEEISTMLSCQPDLSAPRNGTLRDRRGVGRVSETGIWHKSVARRSPGNLDEQVAEFLALVTDDLAVWQRLTTQFRADIFSGLFMDEHNQGLSISPETLLALGARGLELGVDVYCVPKTNERRRSAMRKVFTNLQWLAETLRLGTGLSTSG